MEWNKPSQGLGDTVAKVAHAVGADKVADGWAKTMGKKDCGCKGRQETLNRMFPYSDK